MADDLGSVVSQFVEQRVDRPEPKEVDVWCEAVYAALFSVAFEVAIRLRSIFESPDRLERETNDVVTQICAHAAPWVRARLSAAAQQYIGVNVEVECDVEPLMRNRLVMYFTEAYGAIIDRGFLPEVARSHACFAILRETITQLTLKGLVGLDDIDTVLTKIFDGCEDMSREIAEALEEHRNGKSSPPHGKS